MKPIFKALTIAGSDSGGAAFCLLFRVCLLRLCLFFGLALGLGLTDRAGSGALADPRAEDISIRKLSLCCRCTGFGAGVFSVRTKQYSNGFWAMAVAAGKECPPEYWNLSLGDDFACLGRQ